MAGAIKKTLNFFVDVCVVAISCFGCYSTDNNAIISALSEIHLSFVVKHTLVSCSCFTIKFIS